MLLAAHGTADRALIGYRSLAIKNYDVLSITLPKCGL